MLIKNILVIIFLLCTSCCPLFGYTQNVREVEIGLDTAWAPVKIIDREQIRKRGINNLAELLKFELNIEIEQFPADGGARTRTFDLISRYFKILVNHIPVGSSDMFGGHVDVSAISLLNVEEVEITHAPMGVAYGSGTLAGVVNIVTLKSHHTAKTLLQASVQEESIAKEYNIQWGNKAKGRHIQGFSIDHRLSDKWTAGAAINRNVFNGHWGDFKGKQFVNGPSYQRGFEWSPYRTLNVEGYVSYKGKKMNAFYTYSDYSSDLTFYDHESVQEFDGAIPLPLYAATDYRYVNKRIRHHLHLRTEFWKNAKLNVDVSLQKGNLQRRIARVNTATNKMLEDVPLTSLYTATTLYTRATMAKPIAEKLYWQIGFELDQTHGYFAAAPGTYQSREIDKTVFSTAGFTSMQWQLHKKMALETGLRISSNGLAKAYPTPSLTINYKLNRQNNFQLIMEKVRRFPNHRELYTYLENEFNLLEGNPHLKPETGNVVLGTWLTHFKNTAKSRISLSIQSGYRELKDRIAIAGAPSSTPTQEAFQYVNLNRYHSWHNQAGLSITTPSLKMEMEISLVGLKGNDYADARKYDKYLFHAEGNASVSYTFLTSYWLQTNYHVTGRQAIYSYEQILPDPTIIRVFNRAPAFHLLDVATGTELLNKQVDISFGVRNLLNVKTILFYATDGQDHYRGDLRTRYIGYGRSFYLRLAYNWTRSGKKMHSR